MENEFIPYQEALELKALGFDEPCFGVYINNKLTIEDEWFYATNQETFIDSYNFTTPTFSQTFKYFREKYGLHSYIEGSYPWFRYYINSKDNTWEGFKYLKYEEAELACIVKLIEIVKSK